MTPLLANTGKPEAHPTMELRGVRVHNLKNLNLDIPLNRVVVVSGVSGSGKSSLAFETLFAEGQRRYVESFSIAARQQLERIERPDADRIAHVPVAIAIRSDNAHEIRGQFRSTVAMVGELIDGLRLLFARIGRIICPGCHREIRSQTATDVSRTLDALPAGTRCQLGFTLRASSQREAASAWLARGFSRAIWEEVTALPNKGVRPLAAGEDSDTKHNGEGVRPLYWAKPGVTHDLATQTAWPETADIEIIVDRLVAGQSTSSRVTESADTALREGAGRCWLLIPSNHSVSDSHRIVDGRSWQMVRFSRRLECTGCQREFLPPEPRLFSHISSGACPNCQGTGRDKDHLSVKCPACEGTRLREDARVVRVANRSIVDILRQTPPEVFSFIGTLESKLTEAELRPTELARADLVRRLEAVCEIGLGYLPLDRAAETLSGGEFRRLKLAALIGSRVTGTLVVVDEPSSGLAEAELPNVVAALRKVQTLRNSVIAVDHAPLVVAAADHVIELGPGAGPLGGEIVFQGIPSACVALVGPARSENVFPWETKNSDKPEAYPTVDFPLGKICVVTGPSGSGKTSLVTQVLYPVVCRRLGRPVESLREHLDLRVTASVPPEFVDVVLIDQSPLTKSSRSNPVMWLDVFDEIRQTFATTAEAKLRGFTARHFSFNSSSGGRCRSCLGTGLLKHDMQFLPDITLECPECGGTRYRPEILEVKYRGRSIADVLAMSISEAASFFRSQPRVQTRFQIVKQIGLDYLVLGQPSESLSGGEAQRLKLAARLAMPSQGGCLIICDEPTNGLHPKDVQSLVTCFRELIANGHTLVLADNSPDLIAAADHVINLDRRFGPAGSAKHFN